jgi:O-antigen ligase
VSYPSSPDKRIDRIAIGLAFLFAVTPLLPKGLTHLGWRELGYVELVLPVLWMLWAVARATTRTSGVAPPLTAPTLTWGLFAAAATGSAIYGMMPDNPILSPVFPPRLAADIDELFRPMNMTTHPLYSLRVALTFLEGWIVFRLVVAICRLAPDPWRRAQTVLGGWLAGVSLVSVVALVQYVTRFNLHPYWVHANPSLVRTHSTLDDPNMLGAILALAIGLLVGLLRLDGPRRRLLWAGLLGLAVAGLVTTMSRSALGAAVLAPLSVLAVGPSPATALHRRLRFGARLVVGLVIAAVISSVMLRAFIPEQRRTHPTGPIDMLVKTFDPRESNGWVLRGRLPWWQAGRAMAEAHPVIGVGLGRYPRLMASYGGGPMRENTHNLFLQLAAEAGLIGVLAFVLLCGSIGLALGRGVTQAGSDRIRAMALGGLMGTGAFLLTLLTGHALLLPSGQILFAGFVALTLVLAAPRPTPTPVTGAPSPRGRFAKARRRFLPVVVLGVALIAPAVGLARNVAPRSGPWGHESGLYDLESWPDGQMYRWTSGRALLDLAVPDGSTTLVVRIAAVLPLREGAPTQVRMTAGDAAADISLTTSDVQTVRLPLRPGRRRVVLQIAVSPTFVPPAGSGDPRTLGAQLFVPQFDSGVTALRE